MMAAISEAQRRVMHMALVAEFGEEVGDTIMAHLPPVGWADVATKGDLSHVREVLEARIDQSRSELRGEISALRGELLGEIGRFRGEMGKQTRVLVAWNGAMLIGMAGFGLGIAQMLA